MATLLIVAGIVAFIVVGGILGALILDRVFLDTWKRLW